MNNQKIDLLKKELDKLYDQFKTLYDLSNNDDIEHGMKEIRTYKEELDKGMFFITIQGNLKTGKSTLINTLAREQVAVTKSGMDTTATPYIVTKSKNGKNRIIEYRRKKGLTPNENIPAYKAIINDIKGLTTDQEYFIRREKEFEVDVVEEYTVNQSDTSILLINIQIKPGNDSILNENDIAILDTPGIDGDKAQKNIKPLTITMERSSMILVLQSSITPFNTIQKKALKSYKKRAPEIQLIHNHFDLKHWALPDDNKKFKDSQKKSIESALRTLQDIFSKEFNHTEVDFAKVEAYIESPHSYKNNETVKEEYEKFKEFENNLKDYVKDARKNIQIENVKKDLVIFFDKHREIENEDTQTLKKLLLNVENKLNEINKQKEEIEKQYNEYKKVINALPKALNSYLIQEKKNIISITEEVANSKKIIEPIEAKITRNSMGIHKTKEDIVKMKDAISRLENSICKTISSNIMDDMNRKIEEIIDCSYENLKKSFEEYPQVSLSKLTLEKLDISEEININIEEKQLKKIFIDNIRDNGFKLKFNTEYARDIIEKEVKNKINNFIEEKSIEDNIHKKAIDDLKSEIEKYIDKMNGNLENDGIWKMFEEAYDDKYKTKLSNRQGIIRQIHSIFNSFDSIQDNIEGVS